MQLLRNNLSLVIFGNIIKLIYYSIWALWCDSLIKCHLQIFKWSKRKSSKWKCNIIICGNYQTSCFRMEYITNWSETGTYIRCILILIQYYIILYYFYILKQYLDAAEQDKERYNREFSDYKQTEAYRLFSESKQLEKHENKKERNGTDINTEQNVYNHIIVSSYFVKD